MFNKSLHTERFSASPHPLLQTLFVLGLALMPLGLAESASGASSEDVRLAWVELLEQYRHRSEVLPAWLSMIEADADLKNCDAHAFQITFTEIKRELKHLSRTEAFAPAAQREQMAAALETSYHRLALLSERSCLVQKNHLFKKLKKRLDADNDRVALAHAHFSNEASHYRLVSHQVEELPFVLRGPGSWLLHPTNHTPLLAF